VTEDTKKHLRNYEVVLDFLIEKHSRCIDWSARNFDRASQEVQDYNWILKTKLEIGRLLGKVPQSFRLEAV
jgi:hypothetical protein